VNSNPLDSGECLDDETLTDYLEGSLDPAIKAASEVHLIACDDCRQRLAFYIRLLDDEITPEEEAVIQTASLKWDDRFAPRPARRQVSKRRLLTYTLAAAVILAILPFRFLLQHLTEPGSAAEIVDKLIVQQRPFESRMHGQPHLPRARTRNPAEGGISYDVLTGEMTRRAADDYQLGRFYLLQKNFSRAISLLESAGQQFGLRPELHNDLGVAYLESGGSVQWRRAEEEFRRALEIDPGFEEAAFNLAIVYERIGTDSQAEQQWRRFLLLDSDSAWASEARYKLEGLDR
jgi:tetratricopeptide (TPR) repeat protein